LLLTSEIFTASATSIRADGAHLFWAEKPSDSLTESMAEFGQASPVLVRETEAGLTLVAGHARLAALAAAGQPVLARMVEDADDVSTGLLYLADNAQRTLDDGMRLAALQYFAPRVDEAVLRQDILPRLGTKPKSKDARFLLAWLGMDKEWQALLTAGNVPLAAVSPLARMSADDLAAVKPLFTGLSWSRSSGVNVLTWLFETAMMHGSTVAEVMDRAGMNAALAQGLSPKDAIARLSTAARQARHPELTRLQERYAAIAAEITAGTKWRMNQPDSFETGGSELTIQIKNGEQLTQAVKDLENMAASTAWNKLWSLGSRDE
jgi:ParB family chromosome partitioning protein